MTYLPCMMRIIASVYYYYIVCNYNLSWLRRKWNLMVWLFWVAKQTGWYVVPITLLTGSRTDWESSNEVKSLNKSMTHDETGIRASVHNIVKSFTVTFRVFPYSEIWQELWHTHLATLKFLEIWSKMSCRLPYINLHLPFIAISKSNSKIYCDPFERSNVPK